MKSKALVTTFPTSVLEVLQKARALIKDPKHWHQGFYAVDAKGDLLFANEPKAVAFCSVGAIHKATGEYFEAHTLRSQAFKVLAVALEGKNIVQFNDDPKTKHKDVLLAFDTAIQLAGGPPR